MSFPFISCTIHFWAESTAHLTQSRTRKFRVHEYVYAIHLKSWARPRVREFSENFRIDRFSHSWTRKDTRGLTRGLSSYYIHSFILLNGNGVHESMSISPRLPYRLSHRYVTVCNIVCYTMLQMEERAYKGVWENAKNSRTHGHAPIRSLFTMSCVSVSVSASGKNSWTRVNSWTRLYYQSLSRVILGQNGRLAESVESALEVAKCQWGLENFSTASISPGVKGKLGVRPRQIPLCCRFVHL